MVLLWCIITSLTICLCAFAVKVCLMQKAASEMAEALHDRLTADTNTLIDLSTRDRHMRKLANAINKELSLLRKQRNQYLNGDRELKEAITNISHDLRTPLTAVCGYLELLEKEPQSEAAQRYLSIIAGRTETMKWLTEELFRYSVTASTGDMLTLELVNMNGVLEEAIAAQYTDLCSRGITPDIRMPETVVMRNLNRDAVARVFGNLITNAVRYSDGDLSIVLSNDGTIAFSNTASKLDEVQVGKLFNRFYTVESAHHATGLGLSIAKVLTEQMGGQIQARYAEKVLTIIISFKQP